MLGVLAGAGLLLALANGAYAQGDFPTRPVTIVVAGGAGGNIDATARMLADKMSKMWGQPVIVDDRVGAGGNVGADFVARAQPDGYTLLMAAPAPYVVNQALYGSVSFDPKAFKSISVVNAAGNVLVVSKSVPAKTFEEFLSYIRANPEKVSYASQGVGTLPHLGAELFQAVTGTKLVHVPYRATADAVNDLSAGNVDMMITMPSGAANLVEGSGAKVLAIASNKRLDAFPNVPTFSELGIKGVVIESWNALAAPPGTPDDIVKKINDAVLKAQAEPDTAKQLAAMGMSAVSSTPKEMDDLLAQERTRWADVIKRAGISVAAPK
jgi:tripartite-type tricarboxylate transporter receptor subunit TctC